MKNTPIPKVRLQMQAIIASAQAFVFTSDRRSEGLGFQEAYRMIRDLDPRTIKTMAAQWLVNEVKHIERMEALRVERAAVQSKEDAVRQDRERIDDEVDRRVMEKKLERDGSQFNFTPREHRAWRRHTPEGQMDTAYHEAVLEDIDREFDSSMKQIYAELKQSLFMEWTQELLDTGFGLSDGTRVTWGDATVEQHAERVEMFMGQAKAGVQGAARHGAAIDTITAAGATTLREAVKVDA